MKDLITKCIEGDRLAQKVLYMDHCEDLMKLAWRYTKDIDHARDIVQDTFVRIFHALESFDENKASLKTWMRKICIHEAIGFLRKYKKLDWSHEITDTILNAISLDDNHYTHEEAIMQKIESLPEEHKTILMMYYFDDMSHKEIASMLNIKEASSRSRLSRAKDVLKIRWKAAFIF